MGIRMRLSEKVLPRLESLSPKLRRAALYVLEHPEEVATRSLRQVAKENEMSAPTFARLASALDFGSYEELRNACLSHLRTKEQSFSAKAKALQEDTFQEEGKGTFVVRQASSTIANINQLVKSVDPEQIEACVKNLASARRVMLVGMMSSRPFVDYAAYVASLAFNNWQVYGAGSGADAATLSSIGIEDVAVVISKAPYATRAIEVAKCLKQAGVQVIGITDAVSSPLCHYADTVFLVSTDTPQFFTSHAATLVLLETLIGLVVQMSGDKIGDRISRIEERCREMGDYYPVEN